MRRPIDLILACAVVLSLLAATGCGPACPDGQVATVSGECMPVGDDDDVADDDDMVDDDSVGDDDSSTDDDDDDDTTDPDSDGDGYPASVDCDDHDAVLNLDDLDADGYSSCTGDCDDGDGDVSPQAFEDATDGEDNDCDGRTDEVQLLYLVDGGSLDNDYLIDALDLVAGSCVEVVSILPSNDASIPTLDPARYGAVIIEYRTDDTFGGWAGTAADVTDLELPLLALGYGGATFLEQAGAALVFGNPATDMASGIEVIEIEHPIFDVPFPLLGAGTSVPVTVSPVFTHALPSVAGDLLAAHPDVPSRGVIMTEPTFPVTFIYLGFNAIGTDWSAEGGQLLANIVLFLGDSDCSP